ncbi:MAG: hypothetical protein IKN78_10010 [Bacteroidales bacterium]|nr:hypothetical protein [Bacteroidales bacterium]
MTNKSVTSIIRTHRIANAQQLTACLTGEESKGFLTPYPKGFGIALWKRRLKALKDFYARRV